jgi:hypothetical protein
MTDKPDLDPRLFSQLEIEFLTGYVPPRRRRMRFVRTLALTMLVCLIVFAALYALRMWLLPW